MPLAIELATARLRSLSLIDLSERLDQRFRLLTGGDRSALPRQQTLLATVQWSYSLLSATEQALLRRLSVFVRGFDLQAAEDVCSLDDIAAYDVADLLGSLVDKSLVVSEPTGHAVRYQLLETIRQFAAERLVDSSPQEAKRLSRAHCEHFLTVAEAAAPALTGSDPGPTLRRLDADHANLRRALENATSTPGETRTVLRMVQSLRRYWWLRSRRDELLAPVLPVLERPEARQDLKLPGEALVALALPSIYVDLQRARRLAQQAVEIGREVDDPPLLISALRALAYTYSFAGDPKSGLTPARESVDRGRGVGNDVLLAESLTIYLFCTRIGDPASSDRALREGLACLERTNDVFMSAILRNNAGVDALHSGDIAAARGHLETAFEAYQAMGVENFNVKDNLGMVLREEDHPEGARELVEEGLRIGHRAGDRYALAYSLLCLALIAGDQNDWIRAAELHGAAQSFLDQIGQPRLVLYYARAREAGMKAALGGDDGFERPYERGRKLSPDDTMRLAFRRGELAGALND